MNNDFKGWHVLGAGFVNAMLLAGAAVYAFGVFVTPIETDFGLTREQVYLGISGLYVSMMFWAVLVGRWLDKYSAKTFSILGGIAFGIGYALIAAAQHWGVLLFAVMGPLAFGFTAAGPFLENALAARWFEKKRGRALGIAAIATSAGGAVIPLLLVNMFDWFGWRQATLIMGVSITAVVILISWKFIISHPEDIGQVPDGIVGDDLATVETLARDPKIFSNPQFWLIGLGAGLLLGSDQALLASLVPYGEGLGFSAKSAALVMSIMTMSAIAGKLVVGWLAERWDKRILFALVCLSNIAFLVAVLQAPSYYQLIAVASVVGLAIGGVYPVWTTLTADAFGRQNFARAIGAMNLITIPCILISITMAGKTFVNTGSYDLVFKIFIVQVIAAAVLIGFVRQKPQ